MSGLERVRKFVAETGLDATMTVLDGSTTSSALAAAALGCTVAEIAKSVVFVGSEKAVVAVLSGDKKVDLQKLSLAVGTALRIASADEVRSRTGYAIGGVPPFPHRTGVTVVADSSLLRFGKVWTASGAQNAVMQVSTGDLVRTVGGRLTDVAQG